MTSLPFTVTALYDYKKEEINEINLICNHEYTVIEINQEWYNVRNSDGDEGWVPSNYTQKVIKSNVSESKTETVKNNNEISNHLNETEKQNEIKLKIKNEIEIEKNKQKDIQKKIEQQKEIKKQKEIEIEQQKEIKKQKEIEIEKLKEIEKEKENEKQKEIEKEKENEKQKEIEKKTAEETDKKDEKKRVLICKNCDKPIISSYVTANTNKYHNECFKCKKCSKKLGGKPYLKKDEDCFCEQCYKESFNPKCALCHEIITGPYVIAMDKNWHTNHFVCCDCGHAFKSTYTVHNELPYCSSCYDKNFKVICYICDKEITKTSLFLGNHKIHEKCFKCDLCDNLMKSSETFHIEKKKIYCENHFRETVTRKCKRCDEKTEKDFYRVGANSFHENCLTCYQCQTSIKPSEEIIQHKDDIICDDCNEKNSMKLKEMNNRHRAVRDSDEKGKTQNEIEKEIKKADRKYTYEELKYPCTGLSLYIDWSKREEYLSEEEFKKVLRLTKEEFQKLTLWKQKLLKKKLGLF